MAHGFGPEPAVFVSSEGAHLDEWIGVPGEVRAPQPFARDDHHVDVRGRRWLVRGCIVRVRYRV